MLSALCILPRSFAALAFLAAGLKAQAQSPLDTFQKTVLPAWEELEEQLQTQQGEYVIRFFDAETGFDKPSKVRNYRFAMKGNLWRYERVRPDGVVDKATVWNPGMYFIVDRLEEGEGEEGDASGMFSVRELVVAGKGSRPTQDSHLDLPQLALTAGCGWPLLVEYRAGNLRITQCGPSTGGHWALRGAIDTPRSARKVDFTATLDPKRRYAILASELTQISDAGRYVNRSTRVHSDWLNGVYPRSMDCEFLLDGRRIEFREHVFQEPKKCELPDSAFTLDAYGIDDRGLGGIASPFPTGWGLAWRIALGCLLASVAIWAGKRALS